MRRGDMPHYFAIMRLSKGVNKGYPHIGLEWHMAWNNTLLWPRTSRWTRRRDDYTLYFGT